MNIEGLPSPDKGVVFCNCRQSKQVLLSLQACVCRGVVDGIKRTSKSEQFDKWTCLAANRVPTAACLLVICDVEISLGAICV